MGDPVPRVICCVCGRDWEPGDPRVTWRSLDRRWWCADEPSCTTAARAAAWMTAGEALEADGRWT